MYRNNSLVFSARWRHRFPTIPHLQPYDISNLLCGSKWAASHSDWLRAIMQKVVYLF